MKLPYIIVLYFGVICCAFTQENLKFTFTYFPYSTYKSLDLPEKMVSQVQIMRHLNNKNLMLSLRKGNFGIYFRYHEFASNFTSIDEPRVLDFNYVTLRERTVRDFGLIYNRNILHGFKLEGAIGLSVNSSNDLGAVNFIFGNEIRSHPTTYSFTRLGSSLSINALYEIGFGIGVGISGHFNTTFVGRENILGLSTLIQVKI